MPVTTQYLTPQLKQFPMPVGTETQSKLAPWVGRLRLFITDLYNKLASLCSSRHMLGLDANLPPAGEGGRQYLATDTKKLYIDDGNGHWVAFTGV